MAVLISTEESAATPKPMKSNANGLRNLARRERGQRCLLNIDSSDVALILAVCLLWSIAPVRADAQEVQRSIEDPKLNGAVSTKDERTREAAKRKVAIDRDLSAIDTRVRELGGWGGWLQRLTKTHRRIALILNSTVRLGERTFFGANHEFVFEVNRCAYLLFNSERHISDIAESNPFRSIVSTDRQLKERGIDLIVVPVPTREEIYADRIVTNIDSSAPVSPYRVAFIQALLEQDIEAIDLGPAMAAARDRAASALFQYADPHWSSEGIVLAARELATRLERYSNVNAYSDDSRSYRALETLIPKRGAIVKEMSDGSRERFSEPPWHVLQIFDEDGEPYQDDNDSAILVMGDSYTLTLREHHGHLNAHLAKELGLPLALLSQGGGGPTATSALARKGSRFIDGKRVILLLFSARYLVDPIAERWRSVKLPQ